jgi:chromosome segregation and condensation protein ScpB
MLTKAAVEATLFLSDKPLRAEVIALLLGIETSAVKEALEQLKADYAENGSALRINTSNSIDAFEQLVTEEDFAILDNFDPTDSLQDSCPLVTSFLSSPTFDAYALDTSGYSLLGHSEPLSSFRLTGENIEYVLEEQYQKLQAELIQLRQQVAQSIADELSMESTVARKWQELGESKEAAELQYQWEQARATNIRMRERLLRLETAVQSSYVQKQNSLAFAKASDAIASAKMFISVPARKRLLATLSKTFTAADGKRKVETLLFQSGDEFSLDELAELLDEPVDSIESAINDLKCEYEGRNSAIVVQTGQYCSMKLQKQLLDTPYRSGVPQTRAAARDLINRLQTSRRRVLQAAETTNTQVNYWHENAKASVRSKDELDARKSLTYWYFCKEQYESLHQFADGIDLLVARLCDLQDKLHSAEGRQQVIVLQQPFAADAGSPLESAQKAISNAKKDIKRLDDLVNKSKDQAQTWARRATLAAQMHNDELERQALERQKIYERAAAEIEQRSLQAIALHQFIKESATYLDEGALNSSEELSVWLQRDSGEFDVVDLADFQEFAPKVGQVAVSQLIWVQAQHLSSLAEACAGRSETYTSEASLQNRAEHLTLQLAQLENMLNETNVDWRSLGPNPFMEMAAQVENELSVLKESEC